MSVLNSLDNVKQSVNKQMVSVVNYGERMFAFGDNPRVTDNDLSMFYKLLDDNQGVGIIVGTFDENLSITMISSLAGRILGYDDMNDFQFDHQASLIDLLISKDEQDFIRNKLLNPNGAIWGYCLCGKNDITISVRICNLVGVSQSGDKIWYVSIRKFGEVQFDSLTGAYNRSSFISKINELKNKGVDIKDYAIMFTDVKSFKAINDIYGSQVGDKCLMGLYNHFKTSELNPVFSARKESDKFLLFVKKDNLRLESLPNILKYSFEIGGEVRFIECVCGIYNIYDDKIEVSTMIDCAKLAKSYIHDAFVCPFSVFKPEMRTEYISYANAMTRFDEALQNSEFKVYYQPIIDCKTEKIVSTEALVRWETKEQGVVSPATFIPALEENGNIVRLDKYVYKQVADTLHKRVENGLPIVPVSVNLSRMDFFDINSISLFYKRLENDELARKYIHIEITETAHHSIKKTQAEFITKVNSLGGIVYIDDFGVANSSIDMLSQYDFGVLKLDMQFINGMLTNPKVRVLVGTTIFMAHELGMKVVAEGVETKEQLEVLRGLDCDYIQGYYFSKPLPEKEFEKYFMAHI